MRECADTCLYCDMALAKRHEHDHFPMPQASGGKTSYCVCRNCHDLKDRINARNWPAAAMVGALWGLWNRAERHERVLLAKWFRLMFDAERLPKEPTT